MKAVVIREFGGPEVLRLEQIPTPKPAPDEVLVRVHAVSVNQTLDLKVRQGVYRSDLKLPLVLGVDPSGVIVDQGRDVRPSRTGQKVSVLSTLRCGSCPFCASGQEDSCPNTKHVGLDRWGGYAEYIAIPAGNAIPLPETLSFAEGTVITRHFPTAFNLLRNKAELKQGEWVLIMGAAGALGSSGVQVAKYIGARVIAAAGSDQRAAKTYEFGADFAVNYRAQDLEREVLRITGGHGVDVLFENIADPSLWPGAFNSLAFAGRLVTAGAHGGGVVPLDVKRLYLKRIKITGQPGTNLADVELALEIAASGRIRAIIDRIVPLREVAAAHQLLANQQIIGKIILDPTQ